MKLPTMRLVHALIAKSIAETLIVGTLAVVFYVNAFPPQFHGWGEATPDGISGWVVNSGAPWERVEVQLFIDGRFAAHVRADLLRPDVRNAGWAKDQWHGYHFPIASLPAGPHEARVYALHASGGGKRQTLQLLGDPIRFTSDAGGIHSEPIKKTS